MNAVRLRIQVSNEPPVIAIVESLAEANRLWARWAVLRWNLGKDVGGATIEGLKRCDTCRRLVAIRAAITGAFGFFCSEGCGEFAAQQFVDRMARQGFMTAAHGERHAKH